MVDLHELVVKGTVRLSRVYNVVKRSNCCVKDYASHKISSGGTPGTVMSGMSLQNSRGSPCSTFSCKVRADRPNSRRGFNGLVMTSRRRLSPVNAMRCPHHEVDVSFTKTPIGTRDAI